MSARRFLPPYNPQLALLAKSAPEGDGWLHEVKFDGFRIGAAVEHGRASLLSRRSKDWTAEFASVAAGAARLGAKSVLLDGEVAAVGRDGRTSMGGMHEGLDDRVLRLRLDSPRRRRLDRAAHRGAKGAPPGPLGQGTAHAASICRPRRRRRPRVLPGGLPPPPRRNHLQGGRVDLSSRLPERDLAEGEVRPPAGVRDWRLRAFDGRKPGRDLARILLARRQPGVRREGRHRFPARVGRSAEGVQEAGTRHAPVRSGAADGVPGAGCGVARADDGLRGRVHGVDGPRPHQASVVPGMRPDKEAGEVVREVAGKLPVLPKGLR